MQVEICAQLQRPRQPPLVIVRIVFIHQHQTLRPKRDAFLWRWCRAAPVGVCELENPEITETVRTPRLRFRKPICTAPHLKPMRTRCSSRRTGRRARPRYGEWRDALRLPKPAPTPGGRRRRMTRRLRRLQRLIYHFLAITADCTGTTLPPHALPKGISPSRYVL
ncbi:hypothetical protein KCP69_25595 [Salmonella enterica subsp. enterica]|nr:hypothetical protein KCP69_25595 [Salmonella enterica subsp. enterica]